MEAVLPSSLPNNVSELFFLFTVRVVDAPYKAHRDRISIVTVLMTGELKGETCYKGISF